MHELQRANIMLQKAFEAAAAAGKDNLYVREYDKLLFRKGEIGGVTVHQLVLPADKRKEALYLAHDTLWGGGGHLGARKYAQQLMK